MSESPNNLPLSIAASNPQNAPKIEPLEWRDDLQSALAGLMGSLDDAELNYVVDRMMDGVGEILLVRRHQNGSGAEQQASG